MQIAVAQPGKRGAQQHVAAAGSGQRHLLDRQRLVRSVQDGGFHRASPSLTRHSRGKREPRANGTLIALDPRLRGGDEEEGSFPNFRGLKP